MSSITKIGEFGTYGTGEGEFTSMWSLSVDATRIYVTDRDLKKIDVFDRSNYSFISSVSTGSYLPFNIDVDGSYIYVTTNDMTAAIKIYDKVSPHNFIGSLDTVTYGGICVTTDKIFHSSTSSTIKIFDKTPPYTFVGSFGTLGHDAGEFSGLSDVYVPADDTSKIYTIDYGITQKIYNDPVGEIPLYAGSNINASQSVFLNTNFNGMPLTGCRLRLRREGTPTGTVVAKLYAHSGSYGTTSVPTGTALATSQTVDVSTIPTTVADLVSFYFQDHYHVANTYYCLVLKYSGGDANNYVAISYKTSTGAGNLATYIVDWTPDITKDFNYSIICGIPRVQVFDSTTYAYIGGFNDAEIGIFSGSWGRGGIFVDSSYIYTGGGRTEYLLTFLKDSPYTFKNSYIDPLVLESTDVTVYGNNIYVFDANIGKIYILEMNTILSTIPLIVASD